MSPLGSLGVPDSQTCAQTRTQTFIWILQFCSPPPQEMIHVMQSYCIGPLFLGTGCLFEYIVVSFVCVSAHIDINACESEGLLRDVAPTGCASAQCVCCFPTPPHHCSATGLQLNAPATSYSISLIHTHTRTQKWICVVVVVRNLANLILLCVFEAYLLGEVFCLTCIGGIILYTHIHTLSDIHTHCILTSLIPSFWRFKDLVCVQMRTSGAILDM